MRSYTCGNLKMIEISLARLRLASTLIDSQNSRQLNAISIMSLFNNKCWDFSFVKITINDFIKASRRAGLAPGLFVEAKTFYLIVF